MKSLLLEISLPFAVISLLLAAVFFYVARQQDANARALMTDSGVATAKLTDKTTFTSTGMRKDGSFGEMGTTDYLMHYVFTHPETGQIIESRVSVAKEIWDAVQVDLYYPILYSRNDPTLTSLFNGQEFIDGAKLARRLFVSCALFSAVFIAMYFWLRKM